MLEIFNVHKLDPSTLFNKMMGCFLFLSILPFALILQESSQLRDYVDDLLWEARLLKTYNLIEEKNDVG